jgi:hypothetical protein
MQRGTTVTRNLAIIAGAGIAISAVCMGLAAAIAADSLSNLRIPGFGFDFDDFGNNRPECSDANVAAFAGDRREIAWDGNEDEVSLRVTASATYRPGEGTDLVATGSPEALAHLRVRNGVVEFDCRDPDFPGTLTLILPGRAFREFNLSNSGSLTLQDLSQDDLEVSIGGDGSVHATGTVDDMELNIGGSGEAEFAAFTTRDLQIRIGGSGDVRGTGSAVDIDLVIAGAGDVDLGGMPSQRAEITIAGSGDASVAPSDEAEVTIAGSGSVRLLTKPQRLETRIFGSGNIIEAPATPAPPAPASPAQPPAVPAP